MKITSIMTVTVFLITVSNITLAGDKGLVFNLDLLQSGFPLNPRQDSMPYIDMTMKIRVLPDKSSPQDTLILLESSLGMVRAGVTKDLEHVAVELPYSEMKKGFREIRSTIRDSYLVVELWGNYQHPRGWTAYNENRILGEAIIPMNVIKAGETVALDTLKDLPHPVVHPWLTGTVQEKDIGSNAE